MAGIDNTPLVYPTLPSAADTGVTPASGGNVATALVMNTLPVYRAVVTLNSLSLALTSTADGQGQKVLTLPEGQVQILGAALNINVASSATLSSAVCSLGSVTAADGGATLTSTEADIVASTTVGDGTIGTTAENTLVTSGTVVTFDGGTTAQPIYLNVAGSMAAGATVTVSGTVTIVYIVLADD